MKRPGTPDPDEARPDRQPALDRAIALFKRCLDDADPSQLDDFLGRLSAGERSALDPAFVKFLSAERARLIKLKTLGMTHGFEQRIRMIDTLIATPGRTSSNDS